MATSIKDPLPRRNVASPIQLFVAVSGEDVTNALNDLISDANQYLALVATGRTAPAKTVAQLTSSGGTEQQRAYATDGRKIGEGPGAGTGVHVYFSAGSWRVISTDAPVLS